MERLANRLAGIPGRKNVIWISNGFPVAVWGNLAQAALSTAENKPILVRSLDPRNHSNTVTDTVGDSENFAQQVDHAMHLLDSANVSIYPIEARGLQTSMGGMAGSTAAQPLFEGTSMVFLSDQATQQAMQEIAQRTGGRAFILTNDIFGAIRTAIDDSVSILNPRDWTVSFTRLPSSSPNGAESRCATARATSTFPMRRAIPNNGRTIWNRLR
jgi:VWFA-related protein